MDADNIEDQVEAAVDKAQQLDGFKQMILDEMRARGENVDGGRVIVAHTLTGRLEIDELSPGGADDA
jgi:hypothetical protein